MQFDYEKQGGIDDPFPEPSFIFSEKSVRHGFLRKVYSILLMQILLTAGVIAIFLAGPGVKEYVRSPSGSWLWGTSFIGVIVFILVLSCVEKARRSWPTNILCLMGFTFFESVSLGTLTCHYDTDMVLIAAGLTALVTLGLTLFALQTKIDFTALGGVLFVCLFALIGFGFLAMLMPGRTIHIMYSTGGAILFGLYLVFDTQIMLGGKHKYSISPEEYIFAALNLYLDIVNLFIYILSILNQGNKN